MRLFVYGTLMRGQRSSHLLAEADFLGSAKTTASHTLLDLGPYPALTSGQEAVHGEVYDVPDRLAPGLDEHEGELYTRTNVKLDDGSTAQSYLLIDRGAAASGRRIESGDWRRRPSA